MCFWISSKEAYLDLKKGLSLAFFTGGHFALKLASFLRICFMVILFRDSVFVGFQEDRLPVKRKDCLISLPNSLDEVTRAELVVVVNQPSPIVVHVVVGSFYGDYV